MADVHIPIKVDTTAVDAAAAKAKRLAEVLKEASTLARELASMDISVSIEIED